MPGPAAAARSAVLGRARRRRTHLVRRFGQGQQRRRDHGSSRMSMVLSSGARALTPRTSFGSSGSRIRPRTRYDAGARVSRWPHPRKGTHGCRPRAGAHLIRLAHDRPGAPAQGQGRRALRHVRGRGHIQSWAARPSPRSNLDRITIIVGLVWFISVLDSVSYSTTSANF